MMKKILFLLFAIPLISFIGCSSDDDNGNTDSNYHITISKAGSLQAILAERKLLEPTELIIEGNINDADFKVLKGLSTLSKLNLENVKVITPLNSIPESAFSNCVNLNEIQLPRDIINIGSYAFSGCKNIKSIEIPDKVVVIKTMAFIQCENLKKIILPISLKEIEYRAFFSCPVAVISRNPIPPVIDKSTFDNGQNIITVYVPKGCVGKYKTAPIWSWTKFNILEE